MSYIVQILLQERIAKVKVIWCYHVVSLKIIMFSKYDLSYMVL